MNDIKTYPVEKKPSPESLLISFAQNIKDYSFITDLKKTYQDNDEIKYFQYSSSIKLNPQETDGLILTHGGASGSSLFDEKMALIKCIAESIERASCQTYKKSECIWSSFSKLGCNAVDPALFTYFSSSQKRNLSQEYIPDKDSEMSWTECKNLEDNKSVLLPTQLIYYSYRFQKNEQKILLPISTGAAGGTSLDSAVYKGICEIIERDSFMIFYLNKLHGKKIDVYTIDHRVIQKMISICKRYLVEWHLINISTDLQVPVYMSILIDRTGIGQAVSIGLKCGLDHIEAIIGSFEEAIQTRSYTRHLYEDTQDKLILPERITSIKERAIYWHEIKMIKHLEFWLTQEAKPFDEELSRINGADDLPYLKTVLKRHKFDCFIKDITRKEVKRLPYYIVKVVIPQLQPLYLDERHPYYGNRRLYEVPKRLGYKSNQSLNHLPHPFL